VVAVAVLVSELRLTGDWQSPYPGAVVSQVCIDGKPCLAQSKLEGIGGQRACQERLGARLNQWEDALGFGVGSDEAGSGQCGGRSLGGVRGGDGRLGPEAAV